MPDPDNSNNNNTTAALNEHDVPFGPGYHLNAHRKRWYLPLLHQHAEAYKHCSHNHKQQFVLQHVIEPIQTKGGRFLQRNERKEWETVDPETVVVKVMQSLRDIHKRPSAAAAAAAAAATSSSCTREDSDHYLDCNMTSCSTNVTPQDEPMEEGKQQQEEEEDHDIIYHTHELALKNVQTRLETMHAQLQMALNKMEELLEKNFRLKQENQSLRAAWMHREGQLVWAQNEEQKTSVES